MQKVPGKYGALGIDHDEEHEDRGKEVGQNGEYRSGKLASAREACRYVICNHVEEILVAGGPGMLLADPAAIEA